MGIDYHVFVGAYIECTTTQKDEIYTFQGCNNPSCQRFHSSVRAKFCSDCGLAVAEIKATRKREAINPYDVIDNPEINQAIYVVLTKNLPDGAILHYFLSNKVDSGTGLGFDPHSSSNFVDEINQLFYKHNIRSMQELHSKELKRLCELYGEDNVSVKWGVVFTVG